MAEKRKTQDNPLVRVSNAQDTRAFDAALASLNQSPDFWERQARIAAAKFGVDQNLPPRERCMAIVRKFNKTGGIGGGYRRERTPGEDDE